MKPIRHPVTAAFLAIILAVLSVPVFAASPDPDDESTPSSAVARLKIVKGTVWVRPADSGDWEEYSHNSPVAERARVSVPRGSEAELQFRGSQFLLLQEGSEVDVRQLGEKKVAFRLRSGQVAFSLSKEDFAPVTVKVPGNRDAALESPGLYWLTVDGGTAKFNVRRGEGAVSGEGTQPVTVKAGEEASIGKEVRVSRAGSPDAQPAEEPALTEAEQKAGVPSSAATELREYGEWVSTPEYGYVWRPYATDDWAPYYYGRWTWVYPYGWNWVGYEPWGWWPYHYGWWVSYPAFGWVWCPYNSFYSSAYYYRGYPYPYRGAYYYPGNVRFVNDGRYIRWVPAQPGQTTNRTTAFGRNDTRLGRWDRPIAAGTISTRGGGGRPTATGGRDTPGVSATRVQAAGVPQTNRGAAGSSVTARGRAKSRPFPEGGGQVSAIPQGTGVPWRSGGVGATPNRYSAPAGTVPTPAYRGGTRYGGDGETRGYGGGVFAPPARGSETVPSGGYGGFGGSRSYEGPAPQGYGGGSRGYGGGSGGGGRGGGGYTGGGGRTR